MHSDDPLGNGHTLPLLASGEFDGYTYEFRGDVVGDSAREWSDLRGPHGGSGGGGVGPLPFADLGWKQLGHLGSHGWSSGGWSRRRFFWRRAWHPGTVSGVVSGVVARVVVRFEHGEDRDARLLESGRDDVRFFFLIHEPKLRWSHILALDAGGAVLDRVERADPPRMQP